MVIDGYNKLLYKIFDIPACWECGKPLDKIYKYRHRQKVCVDCYNLTDCGGEQICKKCGHILDRNYRKRRRGKLCIDCYIKELLTLMLWYNSNRSIDERI